MSSVDLNKIAADWLAARFRIDGEREAFRQGFLNRLPDGDWYAYNDYDPSAGPLLDAVRGCGIPCTGKWFSGAGLFPDKTGICRNSGRLLVKEGRADAWRDLETNLFDCPSIDSFAGVPKRVAGKAYKKSHSTMHSKPDEWPASVTKRKRDREAT